MQPAQHPDLLPTASVVRRNIDKSDLIAAALKLLGPNRSVSTLSLREVSREAGIAPNSFYRHFRDVDELAIALIDLAGASLRGIIREARLRVSTSGGSVIRPSVEAFMEQLESDEKLLHMLLREGTVGSDAFKQAVDRELRAFEDELQVDLIRLSAQNGDPLFRADLTARAITRLVFAEGASAMDRPKSERKQHTEMVIGMVEMIMAGTQTLARLRTT